MAMSVSQTPKSVGLDSTRANVLFPRYLPAQTWVWTLAVDEQADVTTAACLASEQGHTKHARAMAQRHAALLQQQEGVRDAWVCDRGYIHVKFQSSWLLQQARGYYQYRLEDSMPLRWVLDYGANSAAQDVDWTAARGAVVGDTLTRLLQWLGHRVESEYTFNDTARSNEILLQSIQQGVQALQGRQSGDAPPSVVFAVPALYTYLAECARKMEVRGDSALLSFASDTMLARHKEQFAHLRIGFDTVSRWSLYGTRTKDVLQELQLAGAVFEENGARWFNAMKYGAPQNIVLIDSENRPTYFATLLTQHSIKLSRYNDRTVTLRDTRHGYLRDMQSYGIEALMFDATVQPEWALHGDVGPPSRFRHSREYASVEETLELYGPNAIRCAMLAHRRHRRLVLNPHALQTGWPHLRVAYQRASKAVPLIPSMEDGDVEEHHAVLLHVLALKSVTRRCVDRLDPYYLYQHAMRLASLIRRMPLNALKGASVTVLVLALDQLRQLFHMLGLDPSEPRISKPASV